MSSPTAGAARRRFYYGWLIVLGYLLAGVAGSGAMLWGFQVFVTPMSDELGWSRGTIYSVTLFRTLFVGALIVLLARLMDKRRWPPVVMTVSSVVLGLSVMALSLVNAYWQYFLFSVVLGGIGFAGAGGQLYQALVPKWFVRLRGKAIAFGSAGTAIGAFVYPTLADMTIDAFGWRTAWVVIGVISLVLLTPISLLIRRSPEDLGLLPDGESAEQAHARRADDAQRGVAEEHSFRPSEVLRYRTTWFIVLATMLAAPTMIGLTSNWAVHFQSIGFTRTEAATVVSTYGAASLVSRLLWGYFLDRHHVRGVAVVHAGLTACTILFLLLVDTFARGAGAGAGRLSRHPAADLVELLWTHLSGRDTGRVRTVPDRGGRRRALRHCRERRRLRQLPPRLRRAARVLVAGAGLYVRRAPAAAPGGGADAGRLKGDGAAPALLVG
ncbi:MAG: MFS transporter [Dehalococcoidia bacterium]|nr:MFS transporter [Dehalococcoidia bacterium]